MRFHHRDAGLLNLARQAGFRLLHLVLYLHLRGVRVGALFKGDINTDRTIGTAGRGKIEQVIQPGKLLFNHLSHAVFQRFSGSAGIGRRDFHRRRRHVRILRNRQRFNRQNTGQHDQNGDNPGENGSAHKETGEHQPLPPFSCTSTALTC